MQLETSELLLLNKQLGHSLNLFKSELNACRQACAAITETDFKLLKSDGTGISNTQFTEILKTLDIMQAAAKGASYMSSDSWGEETVFPAAHY